MSTLERLRLNMKNRFAMKLEEITKSNVFKNCVKQLNLENYEFKMIDPKYKKQLLDTSCYSYSFAGNSPLEMDTIFQKDSSDIKLEFEPKLDHLLKTGTVIMIIDKRYNLVVGCNGFLDLCDINYPKPETANWPRNAQDFDNMMGEFFNLYCKENEEYKKIIHADFKNDDELRKYYGKWMEGTFFFSRPSLRNRGLMFFVSIILSIIEMNLGYKKMIYIASNPASLNMGKGNKHVVTKYKIKIYDYICNDGKKIKDYFDELKTKWNYNQKQIDKMKKCELHFRIYTPDQQIRNMQWKTKLKFAVQSYLMTQSAKSKL
eukprot:543090_1